MMMHRALSGSKRFPLTAPSPVTSPSAGVFLIKSSIDRRRRCAATTSGQYSTKVPGSQSSSIFSRAVRCRVFLRRATASGRAASSPTRCRSCTSARSARARSKSASALFAACGVSTSRVSAIVFCERADVRRTLSQPSDVVVVAFTRGKNVAFEELAGRSVQNVRRRKFLAEDIRTGL